MRETTVAPPPSTLPSSIPALFSSSYSWTTQDFAGSGVVHLLGAGCSIIGCYFMGARRGRSVFFLLNIFLFHRLLQVQQERGAHRHAWPLSAPCRPRWLHPHFRLPCIQRWLSGLLSPPHIQPFSHHLFFPLLISILQASISQPGDGGIVALAIVNTILGASTGGLSVLMLIKVTPSGLLFSPLLPLPTPAPLPQFVWHHVDKSVDSGKWSFLMTLNGALCGMVSQGMQML